jgi:hypothetical protein
VCKLRQLVYLLMALLLFSAPLLACSLPGITMSEEEMECCRHMADQCGGSQMDESHSCCTKAPSIDSATLQASAKYSFATPELTHHVTIAAVQPGSVSHPSPAKDIVNSCSKSPPGHTSVLRI